MTENGRQQFEVKWVKLTDICRPKQWKTIPKTALKEIGYPVYGANGIIGHYDSYNHEHETILIGCRGTCGNVCVCEPRSYVTGNAMCLDELDSAIDMRYLECYLKSFDFSRVISGTSQPQITRQGLTKVLVPLAPLDIQLNIAAKFFQLSSIEGECEKLLDKLDNLIESRFIEMFGSLVQNSMNWQMEAIGKNCLVTKLAGYEYTNFIRYNKTGDVAMIKAQNIKAGKLNDKDLTYITDKVSDSLPRSQLHQGDIVMTYVGANIGDAAVVDNRHKYHLAPNVAKISLDRNLYNPTYFVYMLMALKPRVLNQSSNTAKASLNMSKIRDITVLIPPLSLQQEFADFVSRIDKLRFDVQQQIEKLETLKQSLMQEYFG